MSADTIVAPATAAGRAAVAIVRLSGPHAETIAEAVAGKLPAVRTARLALFRDESGEPFDQGLILRFQAPASYTGENLVEFHCHGGAVPRQALVQRCVSLGARVAEPGEFSLRAFLNGRLDLAQAEAVADLIDADSGSAARAAMRSLQGDFSGRVAKLMAGLVDLRVLLEAAIDFPEEELDVLREYQVRERLQQALADVASVRESARLGRVLRDGIQVVLVGPPNVGKSSLLNRLAGETLAIVTDIPGTTRDTVRCELVLDGVPVHVTDTAGLRESSDPVERIGMERTRSAARGADVLLVMTEAGASVPRQNPEGLPPEALQIQVESKADLLPAEAASPPAGVLRVSAHTGHGLDALRQAILNAAGWREGAGEGLFLARQRHLDALDTACRHLATALEFEGPTVDLVAEELRLAHRSLEAVGGRMSADALLGEIFSRFCIGK
ncbi:MAG: tRNA uridine-5-carboxymethylaminomethyl(34) synthesis GTPase MnmE [Betaproteobacteria bacterium]